MEAWKTFLMGAGVTLSGLWYYKTKNPTSTIFKYVGNQPQVQNIIRENSLLRTELNKSLSKLAELPQGNDVSKIIQENATLRNRLAQIQASPFTQETALERERKYGAMPNMQSYFGFHPDVGQGSTTVPKSHQMFGMADGVKYSNPHAPYGAIPFNLATGAITAERQRKFGAMPYYIPPADRMRLREANPDEIARWREYGAMPVKPETAERQTHFGAMPYYVPPADRMRLREANPDEIARWRNFGAMPAGAITAERERQFGAMPFWSPHERRETRYGFSANVENNRTANTMFGML